MSCATTLLALANWQRRNDCKEGVALVGRAVFWVVWPFLGRLGWEVVPDGGAVHFLRILVVSCDIKYHFGNKAEKCYSTVYVYRKLLYN